MNRRLIIDGQIFQTEARHRGMGRYSISLVQAFLQQKHGYDSVEILLTKNLPANQSLKDGLRKTFDKAEIKTLDLMIVKGKNIGTAFKHNLKTLDDFIDVKAEPVDFLIPSLFQEPAAAVFPTNSRKLLIYYDLIPYLYYDRYHHIWGRNFDNYLKRFRYLFMADKIFTISQSALDNLRLYLGLPSDKLVNIDGAAIRSSKASKRPNVELPENFLLMPTSDDIRKNNERAVLGFEEFLSTAPRQDFKLVITSSFSDKEKERLRLFSNNLIFTDNLPEEELEWLYHNCAAVLFVPEHEGLGLPVLEAVEAGKMVACSSISVFREISETAFCYCDHEDVSSIADAIEAATHRRPDKAAYKAIRSRYSWQKTAKRLLDGIKAPDSPLNAEKPKIAIFTPTPSGYSAIGKIVAEAHATMSRYFDIDYYYEEGLSPGMTRPDFLKYVAPTYSAKSFVAKKYQDYDAVVYHIGNGDYHLQSLKNGYYLPGYAIPHDTNITEAYRVAGEVGLIQPERIKLENTIDQKSRHVMSKDLASLLNRQLGIMTHSRYAAKAAKEVLEVPVPTVAANLPAATRSLPEWRPEEPLVIGLAGIIADVKGIDVIESIAKDHNFRNCQIKLFGFNHAPQATIDRLNEYENVSVSVGLTDFDFQNNLSRLHILVNYRLGYNGETSLSTIEAMRAGVCVIVRDIGWYSELPNEAAIKVRTVNGVFDELRDLIEHREKIEAKGRAAKRYISEFFSHEQYAQSLKALIDMDKGDNPNVKVSEALKSGRIKSTRQYIKLLKDNSLI